MKAIEGYRVITPGELAWRPSNLMRIPNADYLERTGSEILGARLWRLPPKSANTLHKHVHAEDFTSETLSSSNTPSLRRPRRRGTSPLERLFRFTCESETFTTCGCQPRTVRLVFHHRRDSMTPNPYERCQVSCGRFMVDYIRWFLGWQAFLTAPLTRRESEAMGGAVGKVCRVFECWSLERFHFEGLGLRFCFSFQTPIRASEFKIGATI